MSAYRLDLVSNDYHPSPALRQNFAAINLKIAEMPEQL